MRIPKPNKATVMIAAGITLTVASAAVATWLYVPGLRGHQTPVAGAVAEPVPTTATVTLPQADISWPSLPERPWNTVAEHWPRAAWEDYNRVAAAVMYGRHVAVNEPPRALPTGEQVQRAFLAAAGPDVLKALGLTPERLDGHYMSADMLDEKLSTAGRYTNAAKLAMSSFMSIGDAAPWEPENRPYPHPVWRSGYSSAVEDISDTLTTALHSIGDAIAAGEPGIAAGTPAVHEVICVVARGKDKYGEPNETWLRDMTAEERAAAVPSGFSVRTADGIVTTCPGDK